MMIFHGYVSHNQMVMVIFGFRHFAIIFLLSFTFRCMQGGQHRIAPDIGFQLPRDRSKSAGQSMDQHLVPQPHPFQPAYSQRLLPFATMKCGKQSVMAYTNFERTTFRPWPSAERFGARTVIERIPFRQAVFTSTTINFDPKPNRKSKSAEISSPICGTLQTNLDT